MTTTENEKEEQAKMPELSFKVIKKGETRTYVSTKLTALIMANKKIWYLEAAATTSVAAHALMAVLNDKENAEYYLTWEDENVHERKVSPPSNPRLCDSLLKADFGRVHHVGALDRSGKLVVFKTGRQLWRKIREITTTPTLDEWGDKLLPGILKSGMLLKSKSFGLDKDLSAYIVTPDAQGVFDDIVKRFVKQEGLPEGRKANAAC